MRTRYRINRSTAGHAALGFLLFCSLPSLIASGSAQAAPVSKDTPLFAFTSQTRIAIGDLDGDQKPDFAIVDFDKFESANARYSIEFQLSAGSTQTIDLEAPWGGLNLVARDVNGDNALDLLVTTHWTRIPVAVLLNDGHGKFTITSLSSHLATALESRNAWGSTLLLQERRVAVTQEDHARGRCSIHKGISFAYRTGTFLSFPDMAEVLSGLQFPNNSRAPPSPKIHS